MSMPGGAPPKAPEVFASPYLMGTPTAADSGAPLSVPTPYGARYTHTPAKAAAPPQGQQHDAPREELQRHSRGGDDAAEDEALLRWCHPSSLAPGDDDNTPVDATSGDTTSGVGAMGPTVAECTGSCLPLVPAFSQRPPLALASHLHHSSSLPTTSGHTATTHSTQLMSSGTGSISTRVTAGNSTERATSPPTATSNSGDLTSPLPSVNLPTASFGSRSHPTLSAAVAPVAASSPAPAPIRLMMTPLNPSVPPATGTTDGAAGVSHRAQLLQQHMAEILRNKGVICKDFFERSRYERNLQRDQAPNPTKGSGERAGDDVVRGDRCEKESGTGFSDQPLPPREEPDSSAATTVDLSRSQDQPQGGGQWSVDAATRRRPTGTTFSAAVDRERGEGGPELVLLGHHHHDASITSVDEGAWASHTPSTTAATTLPGGGGASITSMLLNQSGAFTPAAMAGTTAVHPHATMVAVPAPVPVGPSMTSTATSTAASQRPSPPPPKGCFLGSLCPFAHIGDGDELPLPDTVCSFFAKGRCLRETCRFFHGTREALAALRAAAGVGVGPSTTGGGSHSNNNSAAGPSRKYRPQDYLEQQPAPAELQIEHIMALLRTQDQQQQQQQTPRQPQAPSALPTGMHQHAAAHRHADHHQHHHQQHHHLFYHKGVASSVPTQQQQHHHRLHQNLYPPQQQTFYQYPPQQLAVGSVPAAGAAASATGGLTRVDPPFVTGNLARHHPHNQLYHYPPHALAPAEPSTHIHLPIQAHFGAAAAHHHHHQQQHHPQAPLFEAMSSTDFHRTASTSASAAAAYLSAVSSGGGGGGGVRHALHPLHGAQQPPFQQPRHQHQRPQEGSPSATSPPPQPQATSPAATPAAADGDEALQQLLHEQQLLMARIQQHHQTQAQAHSNAARSGEHAAGVRSGSVSTTTASSLQTHATTQAPSHGPPHSNSSAHHHADPWGAHSSVGPTSPPAPPASMARYPPPRGEQQQQLPFRGGSFGGLSPFADPSHTLVGATSMNAAPPIPLGSSGGPLDAVLSASLSTSTANTSSGSAAYSHQHQHPLPQHLQHQHQHHGSSLHQPALPPQQALHLLQYPFASPSSDDGFALHRPALEGAAGGSVGGGMHGGGSSTHATYAASGSSQLILQAAFGGSNNSGGGAPEGDFLQQLQQYHQHHHHQYASYAGHGQPPPPPQSQKGRPGAGTGGGASMSAAGAPTFPLNAGSATNAPTASHTAGGNRPHHHHRLHSSSGGPHTASTGQGSPADILLLYDPVTGISTPVPRFAAATPGDQHERPRHFYI